MAQDLIAISSQQSPGLALEILPLHTLGGRVYWLRPRGSASWQVPHDGSPIVERALALLAGHGLEPGIFHSTSWRQDGSGVLLTHLATCLPALPAGFERLPVARVSLARGSATRPPGRIKLDQVIEHALCHLAWLSREDCAIAAALDPKWQHVLAAYPREPFAAWKAEPEPAAPAGPTIGVAQPGAAQRPRDRAMPPFPLE